MVGLLASSVGCSSAPEEDASLSSRKEALESGALVVNECRSGSSGYIELYNPGPSAIDLAADPASCWFVDDIAGGGSPKRITDSVTRHAATSTTCSTAGRSATCGLVAAGERVWIDYAYVNSASADACRLLESALVSGTCGTSYVDQSAGGPTASTATGQCFGRSYDGGPWASGAIACTPDGESNAPPPCASLGQACDDGDACTQGEVIGADCTCGGGSEVCAPPPAPGVVINEFSAGKSGWVELYNPSAIEADVGGYAIDDVASGGSKPLTIAAGTQIAPSARLVIAYGGINTGSADQVRLVDQAGTAKAGPGDQVSNYYSGSSTAGLCFGRQPDGASWASAAIPCTPSASNGGCPQAGQACDDGNACSSGETLAADCTCGGGTAVGCDDQDPCTADSCDAMTGCGSTPLPDGAQCGSGMLCQAGACVAGPPATEAVLVSQGVAGKLLLRGTVVTPDQVFEGEVLIESDTITCAAASCSYSPSSPPSIIDTNGMIFPGLIDAHNHILFDIFDETDWAPAQAYQNHNQWPNDAKYQAMVDAKQYLNGEYGSTVNVGCEMNKHGELKGLIAGTTSIVGAANPANKACYGSLTRTIDQGSNDLGYDKIQASTLFPTASSADSICSNIQQDKTDAFVVHVGEGVDETSRNEMAKLWSVPTTDGCLHVKETAIVHGTSFGETELSMMAQHSMSLIWSPRSNVFLYGLGTDYTKTTNIPLALAHGLNVALAPDWSIGGSQNLLDELRFADQVDAAAWSNTLTPAALVRMVTTQAAKAIGLEDVVGSIAPGKKADLFVIGGDRTNPYDALLGSSPKDVRLVVVNGVALYGDSQLQAVGPASPGCEPLGVCGANKFVCVAEPGGTATDRLGQTLAEIESVLSTELADYDAQNLTTWDFSPIAPLVKCGAPPQGQ